MSFRLLILLLLTQPALTAAQDCTPPEISIAPSDWSVQSGRIPIVISNKNANAYEMHLGTAFVEGSTRYGLADGVVQLCSTAAGATCNAKLQIPGNSATTVYLSSGTIPAGVYDGRIISIFPKCGASQPATIKLYSSSNFDLVMGILVVIASGFLAWLVKVYSSNRVTRAQALLPIALLRERLNALDSALKKVNVQLRTRTPRLSMTIADLMKQLDITSLEVKYGLPRKTPSPFMSAPTISTEFTNFVSQTDAVVTFLTIFMNEGLEQIVELTASGQISSPKASEAVVSIDNFFVVGLKPEEARKGIQDAIEKARSATADANFDVASRPVTPISFDRLILEIRSLNVVGWCIILGVAAISTIYTLVLRPGFGKASDYLMCLTASFGLPTVVGLFMPSRTAIATVAETSQPVSGSPGLIGL